MPKYLLKRSGEKERVVRPGFSFRSGVRSVFRHPYRREAPYTVARSFGLGPVADW